jgi:uncharacterized PurR-regulated membrane protein YhhQ (DUF165 family)
MRRLTTPALVAGYLLAITTANLLLAAVGPAAAVFNALVLVAYDLTARDRLHTAWAGSKLWRNMLALIATGGLISYGLSWLLPASPERVAQIALASCAAFTLAGVADALVFQRLRGHPWLTRANGSNGVAAVVDSLVFGLGAGLPWAVIALQMLAKVAGGAVWAWVLRPRPLVRIWIQRGGEG